MRMLHHGPFSYSQRARQAALATASNWLWNFLLAFFTPLITAEIGYAYGFVFAGCNLAAAIFVYLFLYESAGISLEDVNRMYGTDGLRAWQSSDWSPHGYGTRSDAEKDEKAKALTSHMEHANSAVRGRSLSETSDVTARDGTHEVVNEKNGRATKSGV